MSGGRAGTLKRLFFWREDLPVAVSFASHSPFFPDPRFYYCHQKKLKHSLGCVMVVCARACCVCACVHLCDRVLRPTCKPVAAECRKAHFIYRFAWSFTVLFWRTLSSCAHCFTMTSHALRHVSLHESYGPILHPKHFYFILAGGK